MLVETLAARQRSTGLLPAKYRILAVGTLYYSGPSRGRELLL